MDEKRLEALEERLATLKKLKNKYGNSLEAVNTYLESINQELAEVGNISENIVEIESRLLKMHAELEQLALQLSEKRKQASKILEKKVEAVLVELKMGPAKFQIALHTTLADNNTNFYFIAKGKVINATGIDSAGFMLAPNTGETLKPLASIASGGELSRVVLALKAILANTKSVETVVFDEVDAGIGGSVAEVVGKKLSSLARHHQIICITHLPQIAKFGDHHYKISKHVAGGRTTTTIEPLNDTERINEIARMSGGEIITPATLEHAREIFKTAKQ